MLKANRAATAALAASLLLTPSIVRAQATSAPAEPASSTGLQDTVRSLTEQLNAQRSELDGLRAEVAKNQAAAQAAQGEITARDANLRAAQENQAAAETRAQDLAKQLDSARAELSATKEAQRSLTEQAQSVAATAAAQQTRLNEAQAALDTQRAELLAARNDLDSAQRALVDKDKQIQALTNAGRELVAAGEALEAEKKALAEELAMAKGELLAARNDLGSAERTVTERDKQIAALAVTGRELVAGSAQLEASNLALESRLAEITGPGEEFMTAIAQNLGPDSPLQAIDGRLVLASDLTFAPGSSTLGPEARAKVLQYGQAVAAALSALPADSPWFLRVDGHTDRQAVGGHRYASNRELSAARALAVTDLLVEAGVPPGRIAAAAFGEYRPLDPADSLEAYQANRRIELELDEE